MIKRIRSLIKENICDELMSKLIEIFNARNYIWIPEDDFDFSSKKLHLKVDTMKDGKVKIKILNNNDKINLSKLYIIKYLGDCNFATGTNRFVAIYNGYVYKIAQDREGVTDNYHEFYMSKIISPYVTKCYETNGLISVCEYIRVIPTDLEFEKNKAGILKTLKRLEEITSLMLDVGFTLKNRSNWGIRPSTGECIPLDYGYIYTDLEGIDLTCSKTSCNKKHGIVPLVYSENYEKLVCPKCGYAYTDLELHRLVNEKTRKKMYAHFKDSRTFPLYNVTKPVSYYKVDTFGDVEEVFDSNIEVDSDKEKVIKITKQQAQEVLDNYIELYDRIEYYKKLDYDANNDDLIYLETMRRTLLEFKYNKRYKDMTNEEKLFEPRNVYDSKDGVNKYINSDKSKFINNIYRYLESKFEGADSQTINDIVKRILKGDISLDDISLTAEQREMIFEQAQDAKDIVIEDELDDSIMEDLINDEDESDNKVKISDFEYTGYFDNSKDIIDDTILGGDIEVYTSSVREVNGEVIVDYIYYDNISEKDAKDMLEQIYPIYDDTGKMNIMGVYEYNGSMFVDYEHPGFIRVDEGEYVVSSSHVTELTQPDNQGFYDDNDDIWIDDESDEQMKMLLDSMNECAKMRVRNE